MAQSKAERDAQKARTLKRKQDRRRKGIQTGALTIDTKQSTSDGRGNAVQR